MSYQLRDEQVTAGHRLFQPMLDIQVLTSALNTSFLVLAGGAQVMERWKPGDFMQTISTQFPDRTLRLSSFAPMFAIAQGVSIAALQVTVAAPLSKPDDVALPKAVHSPFDAAMMRLASLTYERFYERWRPDMEAAFGPDINQWPATFAFARRVRDFLIHTNGTVAFKSANARAVTWYNLTYSPADNGRDILKDLSVADLMVLVFELDDQMTTLAFPSA